MGKHYVFIVVSMLSTTVGAVLGMTLGHPNIGLAGGIIGSLIAGAGFLLLIRKPLPKKKEGQI